MIVSCSQCILAGRLRYRLVRPISILRIFAMPHDASDLARRLAHNAEAVCRYYLSNGRRVGQYWRIGDVRNTPGSSLYVRLTGGETGRGAAGKWTEYVA